MPGAIGLSPAATAAPAGAMRPALLLIDMQVRCCTGGAVLCIHLRLSDSVQSALMIGLEVASP